MSLQQHHTSNADHKRHTRTETHCNATLVRHLAQQNVTINPVPSSTLSRDPEMPGSKNTHTHTHPCTPFPTQSLLPHRSCEYLKLPSEVQLGPLVSFARKNSLKIVWEKQQAPAKTLARYQRKLRRADEMGNLAPLFATPSRDFDRNERRLVLKKARAVGSKDPRLLFKVKVFLTLTLGQAWQGL